MSARPLAVRAYRAALHLLPPSVRARDADDMVGTFEAMWRDAGTSGRRVRLAAAVFGRIPRVALAEWFEVLGGGLRVEGLLRTTRHAVRSLARTPAFSVSAILLLGLGVGAVTTIFTLVDHVLLRPLPYPAAERLFLVDNGDHSGPDWQRFQSLPSVDAWASVQTVDVILTGEGEPLKLLEGRVTDRFFELTGARTQVGRLFTAEELASGNAVVLSAPAWRRIFGADRSVLGRSVRIDGAPATVVGVIDDDFEPPTPLVRGSSADVWRPQTFADPLFENRGYHVLAVMGRVRAGATLEDAGRELAAAAQARAQEAPEFYGKLGGAAPELPAVGLQEATVGSVREGLTLLLGAVGLLLLVACANVAHLFMARAIGRAREIALRRALGARLAAIAGQLLCESLLVAVAGGALGAALAALGVRGFLLLSPRAMPRAADAQLDARVLAFVLAVAVATAVVFGLLGLRVGRTFAESLREGGGTASGTRGARALRSGLVVVEVALSLVLVAQAGLLLKSFERLHAQPLGFRVEDVWTVPLQIAREKDGAAAAARMEAIRQELARTPGVGTASYGLTMPMEYTGGRHCCWGGPVVSDGAQKIARMHPIGTGYFEVLGQRVLAGHVWTATEEAQRPAVINDVLAEALFASPDEAVGREFRMGELAYRITGVVAADRHYGPDRQGEPSAYVPMATVPFAPMQAHMVVRAENAPPDLPQRLRAAVWRADPDVPVPTVASMSTLVAKATAATRFDSALFSAFGVIALLLAAGGLYGTLLYVVSTERREMGIRLALGAARGRIQAAVLGRGLRLAGAGAALGTAGAWAASRLLRAKLYQVEPGDPATLAAAVGVLLLTAAVSCWLPARRAASTDPVETLRLE